MSEGEGIELNAHCECVRHSVDGWVKYGCGPKSETVAIIYREVFEDVVEYMLSAIGRAAFAAREVEAQSQIPYQTLRR